MSKQPPTSQQKTEIKAMVDRMMQAYQVDKKQLATILDSKLNTINNWAHFGRVPYEQLVQCHHQTGQSMDWLMFGERPKQTGLSREETKQLLTIMEGVLTGAVEYEMLTFAYPEADKNILSKLQKDLLKWQKGQQNTAEIKALKSGDPQS